MARTRIPISINSNKDERLFHFFKTCDNSAHQALEFCRLGEQLLTGNTTLKNLFPITYQHIMSLPYEERLMRLYILSEIALSPSSTGVTEHITIEDNINDNSEEDEFEEFINAADPSLFAIS